MEDKFYRNYIQNTVLCIIALIISVYVYGKDAPDKIDQKEINVTLGIDHIEKIHFAPDTRVQVGNSSILSYQLIPQKREITFKGAKPGKTSVIIRDTIGNIKAKYLISVKSTSQSKVVHELKEYLGDVEGLEIGVKGDSVYVGGEIVVPSDIGRIVVVLEKYPDVIKLYELSPHTQRVIARKMQKEMQNSGMKAVTVRIVNGTFWLEGNVGSQGEKDRAGQVATAYLPDRIQSLSQQASRLESVKSSRSPIQNFINVNESAKKPPPTPKLLKITAQFVELSKNYTKTFGFKWTPMMSESGAAISFGKNAAGGVSTQSANTLSGTISNLFPKLASAKNAGHARIIQSGVVVVKDGVKATISKSTSKSYPVGTGEFTKSEKAEAKFKVDVTPKILQKENIDLSLGITVSSTTSGNSPETLSNDISTAIIVKSKESAVVGGVVVNSSKTDYDKDPPFGPDNNFENGTPLFSFLRSKSYETHKTQFVIFITPAIIESASSGVNEIKHKFRKRRR